MKTRNILSTIGAAACLVLGVVSATTAQAAEKHKIYLSMSYTGNDWQAEAANMIQAMAISSEYKNKVDLKVSS